MTADDIAAALAKTPYGLMSIREASFMESIVDLYTIKHSLSAAICTAYEIKLSRADFLADLRKQDKHFGALHASHYFYYAAPAGMIKPEEVPSWAGPDRCACRLSILPQSQASAAAQYGAL